MPKRPIAATIAGLKHFEIDGLHIFNQIKIFLPET